MGSKTTLPVNGVEICVETFGDAGDPSVLLIMGAAAPMDWWPDGFCRTLADKSLHVIRYDNRDTGESTTYEPGKPGYTFADLIHDAVGVLDGVGFSRAHVVGASMGGAIAQHLAVEHPDRVETLTLMSTSPESSAGLEDVDLSPSSDKLQAVFKDPPPSPDWTDRAAFIDYLVTGSRPFSGSVTYPDAEFRAMACRIFDRSRDVRAADNHWMLDEGELPELRLPEVRVPTLVLHGTEDPMLPFDHAEAICRVMPQARVVPLQGVGHAELPTEVWPLIVAEIAKHTES